VFSKWYMSQFTDDPGTSYSCVEQYMMAKKAELFSDELSKAAIMAATTPKHMKHLGRRIRGFKGEVWAQKARTIMTTGCYHKFSQNPELKQALLDTRSAVLAEANPYDRVWGIGLSADNRDARDQTAWKGSNWLGQCLMKVRDRLRCMAPNTRLEKAAGPRRQAYWAVVGGRTCQSSIFTDESAALRESVDRPGCICKRFRIESHARRFISSTLDGKKRRAHHPVEELGPKRQRVLREAEEEVQVWTDGACPGNGHGGSVAGIGVFFGDGDARNVSRRFIPHDGMRPTNQTAELSAAVDALRICMQQEGLQRVVLYSDSEYTIKCVTQWVNRWRKNGWKTAKNRPVKNAPLIRQLWELAYCNDRGVSVSFIHVKGHAGVYGNEQADALAVAACA